MENAINFQELFNGFQNTPVLWNISAVYEFEQFSPEVTTSPFIQKLEYKKLRLGKWVEQFVAFQLRQQSNIKIIEENVQIKNNKLTIGELDMLLLKEKQPIHLEIIYKFYLYDPTLESNNTLEKWIGPNRNDSLVYKLKKLKKSQLPLLYNKSTQEYLEHHNLDVKTIKQRVCFKAQLFLPYNSQNINIEPLNEGCVAGFYMSFCDISIFKNLHFYMPKKLEWLTDLHNNIDWLDYEEAIIEIKEFIDNKRSPLIWLKDSDDHLKKCFITWW